MLWRDVVGRLGAFRHIVLPQVGDRGSAIEIARSHVGDEPRAAGLEGLPV